MDTTVLSLLAALHDLGYKAHIYGSPETGWFHNLQPLTGATATLFGFIFDEYDRRTYVYQVECGSIRGAAVIQ